MAFIKHGTSTSLGQVKVTQEPESKPDTKEAEAKQNDNKSAGK